MAYTNVGISKRGMAMFITKAIKLTNTTRSPSGRGMAALCRGVRKVNIYTPSGSAIERRDIVLECGTHIIDPCTAPHPPKKLIGAGVLTAS
jgi:hypothetical protein